MSKSLRLFGVIPALVSPLTDDGNANRSATKALVQAMVKEGVDGLYVLGSTGVGIMLPEKVRMHIAEEVVSTVAGSAPVVIHVGSTTTEQSVRLAKHAAGCGADGVSSIAPSIGAGSQQIVTRHYHEIASATDLPFVVYHYDGATSMHGGVAAFSERLLAIPNIGGIKVTSRDMHAMTELHAHVGDSVQIYSGADDLMCHALLSGAEAAIGTYYNVFLGACTGGRLAAATGKIEEAVKFMHAFRRAIDLTIFDPWGFMRAALRQRYGVDVGPAPAPLGSVGYDWTDTEVRQIMESVDAAAPGASG